MVAIPVALCIDLDCAMFVSFSFAVGYRVVVRADLQVTGESRNLDWVVSLCLNISREA